MIVVALGSFAATWHPTTARQAAKFLLDTPGAALIATGFYIHARRAGD